jgi:hypothetical protein
MKPFLLTLPLTLLLFSGCKPTGIYFRTGNDLRRSPATLYMTNKDSISGELTVDLEDNFHTNAVYKPYVQFTPKGKSEIQDIPLNELSGYRIGAEVYELKIVDIKMNDIHRLLFVHRLTPDSSRIRLYHLHASGLGNQTGEAEDTYYLSLPGFAPRETINTHGIRVIPGFETKMSEIVADCPSLAKKIRAKENGYFIPFASFKANKHPEVLLRIINEYNQCR